MSGWWRNDRFWISLTGGIALSLVAFFAMTQLEVPRDAWAIGTAVGFLVGCTAEYFFASRQTALGLLVGALGIAFFTIMLYDSIPHSTAADATAQVAPDPARGGGQIQEVYLGGGVKAPRRPPTRGAVADTLLRDSMALQDSVQDGRKAGTQTDTAAEE